MRIHMRIEKPPPSDAFLGENFWLNGGGFLEERRPAASANPIVDLPYADHAAPRRGMVTGRNLPIKVDQLVLLIRYRDTRLVIGADAVAAAWLQRHDGCLGAFRRAISLGRQCDGG
jgi:hypothetical protein